MSDYGLREIFKQDFEQLHLKFFQLDRMIEVSAHCKIKGFSFHLRRSGGGGNIRFFAIHNFAVVISMSGVTNNEIEPFKELVLCRLTRNFTRHVMPVYKWTSPTCWCNLLRR